MGKRKTDILFAVQFFISWLQSRQDSDKSVMITIVTLAAIQAIQDPNTTKDVHLTALSG